MIQNIIISKFTELIPSIKKMLYSTKSNYCANVDHSTGNLLIYPTNIEGECEMLH